MKYYLGIDGGGTKTKYVLANELGKVVAEYVNGTTHYMQVGLDGLEKVMASGVDEVCKLANISLSDISTAFVATGGYGAISVDTPKVDEAINKALRGIKHQNGNDMENAHAGSLAGKAGINVIAGTGSIGLGITKKGEQLSSGGWGPSFGGDEGSAYWLATKLLVMFSRQADHRNERTLLYDYMMEKYHLARPLDILNIIINEYKQDRTKVASFAMDVYELALKGDKDAIKIYEMAARELADIYIAIKKNLDFESEEVLGSYSGGVYKAGKFILDPLKEFVKPYGIKIVEPKLEPDKGSLVLAMKLDNIELVDSIIINLQ